MPTAFSFSTFLQYAVFAVIAYVLAGAPLFSMLSGSQNHASNQQPQHSFDKIDSLMIPDPNLVCEEHGYKIHVFNREPLVVYIEGFLSGVEADRLVELSNANYTPSTIWTSNTEHINPSIRNSSKSPLPPTDHTVSCIAERARAFQGWRPSVFIEKLWAQRYTARGHYMHHYDFSAPIKGVRAGRVSTFMVYLEANCTGGGTNFPRISAPRDRRWCEFIECGEQALVDGQGGEVEGVTFKARKGNAVFWENLREDGSAFYETWHAGLPVKEGVKVGLNIWSWWQEGYMGEEGKVVDGVDG